MTIQKDLIDKIKNNYPEYSELLIELIKDVDEKQKPNQRIKEDLRDELDEGINFDN